MDADVDDWTDAGDPFGVPADTVPGTGVGGVSGVPAPSGTSVEDKYFFCGYRCGRPLYVAYDDKGAARRECYVGGSGRWFVGLASEARTVLVPHQRAGLWS